MPRSILWVAALALVAALAGGAWWWWDARHEGDVFFVSASGGSKAINRAIAKCAAHGGEVYLRAVMDRTGKCSDGMSDLRHPYMFSGVGKPGQLNGCCRIKGEGAGEGG